MVKISQFGLGLDDIKLLFAQLRLPVSPSRSGCWLLVVGLGLPAGRPHTRMSSTGSGPSSTHWPGRPDPLECVYRSESSVKFVNELVNAQIVLESIATHFY